MILKKNSKKELLILGTRGIPAEHGGFETFAEKASIYFRDQGWKVIVYCQEESNVKLNKSIWKGITRIHIGSNFKGPLGTIIFDLKCVLHALNTKGIVLTLGYNTAIFNSLFKIKGVKNIINMDGIEWKRKKWNLLAKLWFWFNEISGCIFGDHLIADHPKIKEHLLRFYKFSKISMIPYGADYIRKGDENLLEKFELKKGEYSIIIARPEPENSILEIVKSFSAKRRNHHLVVLGEYNNSVDYQKLVKKYASDEVKFLGPIYKKKYVSSLRYFARYYFHGHQVGGTNPSLVESLGAGCPVIAHDNIYNKWVLNNGGLFFKDTCDLLNFFEYHLNDQELLKEFKNNVMTEFKSRFRWENILKDYDVLLNRFLIKGDQNR